MSNADLLVWSPSRSSKFTRIENPATDDSGETVELYDGATLTVRHLNLFKSDKAQIPDFLYDVGLSLIVSERAWGVIRTANVPGVEAHPATLWDRNSAQCASLFWVNVISAVPLLDREASQFRASKNGVILRFKIIGSSPADAPEYSVAIIIEVVGHRSFSTLGFSVVRTPSDQRVVMRLEL